MPGVTHSDQKVGFPCNRRVPFFFRFRAVVAASIVNDCFQAGWHRSVNPPAIGVSTEMMGACQAQAWGVFILGSDFLYETSIPVI